MMGSTREAVRIPSFAARSGRFCAYQIQLCLCSMQNSRRLHDYVLSFRSAGNAAFARTVTGVGSPPHADLPTMVILLDGYIVSRGIDAGCIPLSDGMP